MIAVYLLVAFFLLALNALFVLAEFASVKLRTSKTRELLARGERRARLVQHVQAHIDEYLSVCQLGITFSSVGLGFVGEPAFARLVGDVLGVRSAAAHGIAITAGYILLSGLHIVIGELVPKSLALRHPERSALFAAPLLRVSRSIFYVPLVVLNGVTNLLLRLFRVSATVRESEVTEQEIRIILAQAQESGSLSFERLLLLENVFDFGALTVRDLMRPASEARTLSLDAPWEENLKIIRETRFSRYPVVESGRPWPTGVLHVKDLVRTGGAPELRSLTRPYVKTVQEQRVERLLTTLRRDRSHFVLVGDREDRWVGFFTLEDVVEEIVGSIEDEFEVEVPPHLTDVLSRGRVVLGIEAPSLEEAIVQSLERIPAAELPLPLERITPAVLDRERAMCTYLGRGFALPHARIEGLNRPLLVLARSDEGIPIRGLEERARFLFLLLAPASAARLQVRLLSKIAGLIQSESFAAQIARAKDPEAVVEAVRAAEMLAV